MKNNPRFWFQAQKVVATAPVFVSYPDPRPSGLPSCIYHYGDIYYAIMATLLRGGGRRACVKIIFNALQQRNPGFKFDSKTARLGILGGVKGTEQAKYLDPQTLQEIRELFVLLDVYGAGDPIMFGGTLGMGIMISKTPILKSATTDYGKMIVEATTTLPIIRRTILSDSTLSSADISDPEVLLEDADVNRRRSRLENAVKLWLKLERKHIKNGLSPREDRQLQDAKDLLSTEAGQQLISHDDAQTFVDTMKRDMEKAGKKTVSEGIPHSMPFIPAGTEFNHEFHLFHTTTMGSGLFMAGWNYKYLFNPIFGGMFARGGGGFLECEYNVLRQLDDGQWVSDCTVIAKPNFGVKIENGANSALQDAWKQWREADITKFKFSFAELNRIVMNGDEE